MSAGQTSFQDEKNHKQSCSPIVAQFERQFPVRKWRVACLLLHPKLCPLVTGKKK